MHPVLKDLLLIDRYRPVKVGFLSIETPIPPLLKKITTAIPVYTIGLNLRREYRHLAMAWRALGLKQVETILVFEVYLQHLSFTLILLALTRKRVLLCLHGEQQFAASNPVKFLGLLYLKLFLRLANFQVVLFELDDQVLPATVRLPAAKKIIIPLPLRSDYQPRLQIGERLPASHRLKIGVVGALRPDKPIYQLVQILDSYVRQRPQDCELVIGLPFGQKIPQLQELQATLYDTTIESDYFALLQELDILVVVYQGDRYFYRASGVISDALSCGCYVLASDRPVIRQQLSQPVAVGDCFQELAEVEACLDRAIGQVRQQGQDNHWRWREARSPERLAQALLDI